MKTVAQILSSKGDSTVHSIAPDASVLDAVRLMADKRVGALVVMAGETLAGIVSERDYVRRLATLQQAVFDLPVSEIMTARVVIVSPSADSRYCMEQMTSGRLRHLPVVDEGRLVGLVSIGDLVKDIISAQESLIQHLEQYIRGE